MRYEAAYARQSVEKKNSLSIKGQLDLCIRTSGNSSLLMYSDQGYSGKNTDRPDFQRLLKDIKADKISKLYVYRLDRFSRSIADFGQLWNPDQQTAALDRIKRSTAEKNTIVVVFFIV